jgi:hypothetical protein
MSDLNEEIGIRNPPRDIFLALRLAGEAETGRERIYALEDALLSIFDHNGMRWSSDGVAAWRLGVAPSYFSRLKALAFERARAVLRGSDYELQEYEV